MADERRDFTGRKIVVTGAARGQGAAEAAALVARGAEVHLCDVRDDAGRAHAGALGPLAHYHRLDVTREDDWAALAAHLGDGVDGLVNNAGIAERARVREIERDAWDRCIAVDLTGPMLGIRTLAPLMVRGSAIVNVGSVAALTGHYSVAYTVSKWGLRGLTRTASVDLAADGIRVNIVHPGLVLTELSGDAAPPFVAAHLSQTPLARAGTPADIVPTVLFLLSEEASYITGGEFVVDGGYTAHGGAKAIYDALDAAAT